VDTPAPDWLTSLVILLEYQQSRLAAVRDRIERVAMQQTEIQYRLLWLDEHLNRLQQTLTRGYGRP